MFRYVVFIGLLCFILSTASFAKDISCKQPTDECNDQIDCGCDYAPELSFSISTGETAEVGTVITAVGGRAPYSITLPSTSLSLVEGESNAMQIQSISPCINYLDQRWGTITVKDACGQSVSQQVRFPGGHWISSSVDDGGSYAGRQKEWSEDNPTCGTFTVSPALWGIQQDSYGRYVKVTETAGIRQEDQYFVHPSVWYRSSCSNYDEDYYYDFSLDGRTPVEILPGTVNATSGNGCLDGCFNMTFNCYIGVRTIREWVCY